MLAHPSRLRRIAARLAIASSLAFLLIAAEACGRSQLEDLLGADTTGFTSESAGHGGSTASNSGAGAGSTNGVTTGGNGGFSTSTTGVTTTGGVTTDGVGGFSSSVTDGVGGFTTSSNGVVGVTATGVGPQTGVGGFSSSVGVGGSGVTTNGVTTDGVGGFTTVTTDGVGGFTTSVTTDGVGGFTSSVSVTNGVGGFTSSVSVTNGVGGFTSSVSVTNGVGGFTSSVSTNGVGGFTSSVSTNGVGGGSSVSTGGIVEDCTNGKDDDFDGLIDCADPDCFAGFTCAAPAPPGGWAGPVAIWQGMNAPPPSCSDSGGFPTEVADGMEGPSAAPPICTACGCSAPKGVGCQVATEGFYNDGNCSGGPGNLTIAEGVCQAFVTLSYDPASTRWQSAPAAGGACIPKANGNPIIPPIQWAESARVCGDPETGGGCGGSLCVPKPGPEFDSGLCIYRVGNLACPAGPYSAKHLYFESADDTRMCSGCDCGAPTGTSCVGTMKLFSDQNCSTDEVDLANVSQCAALAPDPTPPPPPYESLRSIIYTGTPSGAGSCVSIPSTPSGTVTETDPITICCTP